MYITYILVSQSWCRNINNKHAIVFLNYSYLRNCIQYQSITIYQTATQ